MHMIDVTPPVRSKPLHSSPSSLPARDSSSSFTMLSNILRRQITQSTWRFQSLRQMSATAEGPGVPQAAVLWGFVDSSVRLDLRARLMGEIKTAMKVRTSIPTLNLTMRVVDINHRTRTPLPLQPFEFVTSSRLDSARIRMTTPSVAHVRGLQCRQGFFSREGRLRRNCMS